MRSTERQLLLWRGPDHAEPNAITWEERRWPGFVAQAAISVGRAMPLGESTNEDGLVLVAPLAGAPAVLAVADGHYGPEAAGVAIDAVARVLGRRQWTDLAPYALSAALEEAVRAAGERVLREAEGSETTLLAGLLAEATFHWASVGDSFLYHFGPGSPPRVVNGRDHRWLGAVRNKDPMLLATAGSLSLEKGESVLLATDGLPEPARGGPHLAPEQVEALLTGVRERALEALVRAALERGGDDSIAAILVSHEA